MIQSRAEREPSKYCCASSGMPVNVMLELMQSMPPATKKVMQQTAEMMQAADAGTPLVHDAATCPVCSKK